MYIVYSNSVYSVYRRCNVLYWHLYVDQFPVKTRGKLNKQSDAADDGSDWDASSASSTSKKESEKPAQPAPQAQPSQSQAKPKKKVLTNV